MKNLFLFITFFISLQSPSSFALAETINSCSIIEILFQDYKKGTWHFTINGLSTGTSGGMVKFCYVESQMRTYAMEACINSYGVIENQKVVDIGIVGNKKLKKACYIWAKKTDLKVSFTCDASEASCESQEPHEIILEGAN